MVNGKDTIRLASRDKMHLEIAKNEDKSLRDRFL